MKSIKKIIRYFKRKIGKFSSQDYVEYLVDNNVSVGKGTYFFDWKNTIVDIQRPWLLEIGEYCKITSGVTILTHDYSRSVLRRVYGEIIEGGSKTIIGNNVFLGINAIVLAGTKIGDNCIVGAGSICMGTYPSNSVIAGNPAKVICSLDDYYRKRKERYVAEAIETACSYYKKNGEWPDVHLMGEFFPLYLERSKEEILLNGLNTKLHGDDREDIETFFLSSERLFDGFDNFLKVCRKKMWEENENRKNS